MSLILSTTSRLLTPLLLLFSVFLLLRGHNDPGGGFTGGLVAAATFALQAVAVGPAMARHALGIDPRLFIPVGLLIAGASGVLAMGYGDAYMTAQWAEVALPNGVALHLGTPLVFDVGVYLVVLGVTLTIILTLAEREESLQPRPRA